MVSLLLLKTPMVSSLIDRVMGIFKKNKISPSSHIISQANSLDALAKGSKNIDLFADNWKQEEFDVLRITTN